MQPPVLHHISYLANKHAGEQKDSPCTFSITDVGKEEGK